MLRYNYTFTFKDAFYEAVSYFKQLDRYIVWHKLLSPKIGDPTKQFRIGLKKKASSVYRNHDTILAP